MNENDLNYYSHVTQISDGLGNPTTCWIAIAFVVAVAVPVPVAVAIVTLPCL